jgi:hypothetical protein
MFKLTVWPGKTAWISKPAKGRTDKVRLVSWKSRPIFIVGFGIVISEPNVKSGRTVGAEEALQGPVDSWKKDTEGV